MDPLHHPHAHHAGYDNLEPFPHPRKFKRLYDRTVLFAGATTPLLALPQLYTVWVQHDATGVSFITWTGLAIAAIIWVTYSVLHRARVMLATSILWALCSSLIATGAIIYR